MVWDAGAGWTVGRLLAERARGDGSGRTFLIVQPHAEGAPVERFSVGDADTQATLVGRGLLSLGVGPGDRVLVSLPNGAAFVWAWLGAARAGAAIVPANQRWADEERAWLVGHARPALVVARAEEAGAPPWRGTRVVTVEELARRGEAGPALPEGLPREEDDVAVLYTSGSTSRPKGVRLSHASYMWAARTMAGLTGLGPDDRHLVVNPLFHVNAQTYSTMPVLWAGASMVLCEKFSASRFLDWARAHACTAASLVTAHVRILATRAPAPEAERAHGLRWIGCAQVTPALEERLGVRTVGWYGMTETVTTPIASGRVGPRRAGTVGRVTAGYRVRLDAAGALEVEGVPGRTLMTGYLDDAEATRAAFAEGEGGRVWLRTGDLFTVDGEGNFRFAGRAKDMIKVGGENVAALEVERVLSAHPAVLEAAAIGVPDPVLDEVVKAFVVLREGAGPATAEELRAFCRTRLADFKVPRAVEVRDDLPRVTLDKIDKPALRRAERGR